MASEPSEEDSGPLKQKRIYDEVNDADVSDATKAQALTDTIKAALTNAIETQGNGSESGAAESNGAISTLDTFAKASLPFTKLVSSFF